MIERDVWVSVERPAFERAVDNLVRNARKHGQGRVTITVGGEDGSAFIRVSDEGPGIPPAEAEKAFERFWRGSAARGEGSGPRAGDRAGDRRAPRRPCRGRRRDVHALCQRTLKVGPYNCRKMMNRLRTASSPRLLAIVAVLVAVVAGAGIAQAALNSATKPAPKSLDRAVLDALNAPARRGRHRAHRVHQQPAPLRLAAPRHRLPHPHRRDRAPVARQRRAPAPGAAVEQRRRADRLRRQALPVLRRLLQDRAHRRAAAGREAAEQGRQGARDARRRPGRPREARQAVDAVRRAAGHERRAPELHRPDRPEGRRRAARRGRARLGRRPRRAAARGRLRPGHAGAGARARGDRHLLRPDRRLEGRHHAAARREGDRAQPAQRRRRAGQADARRRRRGRPEAARLPALRPGRARRPAAPSPSSS